MSARDTQCAECGGPLEGWTGEHHSQQCKSGTAKQNLWDAIESGNGEQVMIWAEVCAALLRGDEVAVWDVTTGAREL